MDIQKYIKSGVLEAYCMGMLSDEDEAYLIQVSMLYPEVKAELTAVEIAMEKLAGLSAAEPSPTVKDNILASLGFNDTGKLNIDDLPVIDHADDPQLWLNALRHLIPDKPEEDFICHVIRDDSQVRQMLVISKTDVPEEEHGDFLESLLVLDGRCECTIGDKLYALGAGDFIEIPLNVVHNIKLTTPVVTAILQYKFV